MNIEHRSAGVGVGVDVWTASRNADGGYVAEAMGRERLEPSDEFIESMMQAMRAQRDRTFGDRDEPAEAPPRP